MPSPNPETFQQDQLRTCDLVVGATYLSGTGSIAEEPITQILKCGNQGGIRTRGSARRRHLVALYTTFRDLDWPDSIDVSTGTLLYYGDNKRPGHDLHETPKDGNSVLRDAFHALHVRPHRRQEVPPFFVFSKAGSGRDVRFEGLAAPGASNVAESEDLVASWKTVGSERFQNYRAVFTILDETRVSRTWIEDVVNGRGDHSREQPSAWMEWVSNGVYRPLQILSSP